MANPAGVYADADLMTAWLRQVALLHAEAPAGFWNDHCTHFRHGGFRYGLDQINPEIGRCRRRADKVRSTVQCRPKNRAKTSTAKV